MKLTEAQYLEKFHTMMSTERELYPTIGEGFICGVDEAGRGPLAGPVYAGCVVLDENKPILGVDDSKKLSKKKREALFDIIMENAIFAGVGFADNNEIDTLGINPAVRLAMIRAIKNAMGDIAPKIALVDGNVKYDLGVDCRYIIKGDSISASIAAASILAKVARDRVMEEYDIKYPGYDFAKNAGYGTKDHINALRRLSLTPIHRKGFCQSALSKGERE